MHVGFLLLDDTLDVHEALILPHIPQGVGDQQDARVLDVGRHPLVGHILGQHYSVDVLAFILVLPLEGEYLDVLVDVNGVIEQTGAGEDVLHGLGHELKQDVAPYLLVHLELRKHRLRYLLQVDF